MTVEAIPFQSCNLHCTYCYENILREAGNYGSYDVDKMIASLDKINQEFTVFGGEPLLMKFEDLKRLLTYGFKKWGKTGIQTNGSLVTARHLKMFKECNTFVGVSIDGPGDLNTPRSDLSGDYKKATRKTENTIKMCVKMGIGVGLIITLHKYNASPGKLFYFKKWLQWLDSLPVVGEARLHLLETHHHPEIALSQKDTIDALLDLASFEMKYLKNLRFDKFKELLGRLELNGDKGSCVWNDCDPYTTDAVRGVSGNGTSSNCGRANKDGVDWLKGDKSLRIRQLVLYNTSQEDGGCKDCRFFLSCRGFCPGTALDTDWRNRTEHCESIKALLTYYEGVLLANRKTPLSMHPDREKLEKKLLSNLNIHGGQNGHTNVPHVDWSMVNGKKVYKAPVR